MECQGEPERDLFGAHIAARLGYNLTLSIHRSISFVNVGFNR